MFKKLRIAVWLYLLVLVAAGAWLTKSRSTDWDSPLWVVVFPIAGDTRPETEAFVRELQAGDFRSIESFMARESKRYNLPLTRPITVKLAQPLEQGPPEAPAPESRNVLTVMLWSLRLRFYAWQMARREPDVPADVRMFVTFHDPDRHGGGHDSLAVREGLIGVVNAFASRRAIQRNNIIIAHEFLHTVGATDKYDPATNLPLYPDGYAEPRHDPPLPQRFTEIMGGRRPVSEARAEIPDSLARVRIGALTAAEIRWTEQ